MMELVILGLAVSAMSVTLSMSALCQGLRDWMADRHRWLGKLFRCPYCLSHWLALGAVLWCRPSWAFVIDTFAVVAIAGGASFVLVKFLDLIEVER